MVGEGKMDRDGLIMEVFDTNWGLLRHMRARGNTYLSQK